MQQRNLASFLSFYVQEKFIWILAYLIKCLYKKLGHQKEGNSGEILVLDHLGVPNESCLNEMRNATFLAK